MDLKVARANVHRSYVRRVGLISADQHQALPGGAVIHVQVQPILSPARLTVVLRMSPEADCRFRRRVAVDSSQGSGAHEVNYVHLDWRRLV